MAHEITVPRLGWSMEEGTFLRWLKQDGDFVKVGEPLFELEGEKAAQEIEAVDSGILRIAPESSAPGTVIAVGAILGYLVAEGEKAPSWQPPASSVDSVEQARTFTPSSRTELEKSTSRRRPIASPRARRVAKELQIDWAMLKGTGRGGRVRESDVRNATPDGSTRTSRRYTIAARLRNSQAQTVPVTLTSQADATNLVALRSKLMTSGPPPAPSYADIIAKLVAGVLKQHPYIAARWCNGQLKMAAGVHIGIAVDTDDGLLVPVIRDVDTISLAELSGRLRELIHAARTGSLAASDMQDGTFTITNLGAYGIDAFTPVINYPEIAILGLGAIRPMAVVYQNQCVARDVMTLSLTFDHAAIDGAPAARFLQSVCQVIEQLRDWPTAGH